MALDKVKPLKLESADTGGTQNDEFPTSLNQHEDYVECRGVVLDDATRSDESTVIAREDTDMLFKDGNNPAYVTLTQLLEHKTLIHFIDEGPADGFTSGATKTVTGTLFPTNILWSRADTTKLVEQSITWTGIKPTTIQWKLYAADGATVLVTVTDTISFTGIYETGRTRVIA